MLGSFGDWVPLAPLWSLALVIFSGMVGAVLISGALRRRRNRKQAEGTAAEYSEQTITVSAVMGLLALIVAFTFSIALERFDTRRVNVLNEANAIGTTYLRAQLLEEPHRDRMSKLLVAYTDTRITLATEHRGPEQRRLLSVSDRQLADLWAATVAAFPSMRDYSFSHSFMDSMSNLIDMDARARQRQARAPGRVSRVLFYQYVAAPDTVVVGREAGGRPWVVFVSSVSVAIITT